jgi:hypothetical protein
LERVRIANRYNPNSVSGALPRTRISVKAGRVFNQRSSAIPATRAASTMTITRHPLWAISPAIFTRQNRLWGLPRLEEIVNGKNSNPLFQFNIPWNTQLDRLERRLKPRYVALTVSRIQANWHVIKGPREREEKRGNWSCSDRTR